MINCVGSRRQGRRQLDGPQIVRRCLCKRPVLSRFLIVAGQRFQPGRREDFGVLKEFLRGPGRTFLGTDFKRSGVFEFLLVVPGPHFRTDQADFGGVGQRARISEPPQAVFACALQIAIRV